MAPPSDSQDDRVAFVDACIVKRRIALDVWESLGLTSGKSDDSQKGYFAKEEANELQGVVEQIGKSFVISYRGNLEELESYLAEENAFSNEVFRLGQKYGEKIWGRLEDGEIRLSGQSQGGGIEEHDWDDSKGRKNILFYIHCWIICIVAREYKATPRRGKGKGRARESGSFGDQHNQAIDFSAPGNTSASSVSFQAPEPPRMYPTPESRREATSTSANNKTSSTFLSSTTQARSNGSSTPNKRKAHESHEWTPSGKLPKPSKSARTIPVLFQEQRDLYSIPASPPAFPNLKQLSSERRRESAYDTDGTWVPREATADTETVVDGEEIHPREVDSCLQNAIALVDEDEMQYEYEDENAAGPSGTYRNPLRQDSVIPNDTQPRNGTREVDTHPPSNQLGQLDQDENATSDAFNNAIIRSLISDSDARNKQNRAYRLELFKLLLSYLNSINQFSPDSYDLAAEERMNFLLNQFHCTDRETWHSNHSDNANRLQLALGTWMSMRHRLSAFRGATGYFGNPGQQWGEFLRGLDDVPSAEAILAFVELKHDGELEEGRELTVGHGFDEDLMMVFDGLTRVKGCNGPEAFKGVRRFNEALLKWFEE